MKKLISFIGFLIILSCSSSNDNTNPTPTPSTTFTMRDHYIGHWVGFNHHKVMDITAHSIVFETFTGVETVTSAIQMAQDDQQNALQLPNGNYLGFDRWDLQQMYMTYTLPTGGTIIIQDFYQLQ